MWSYPLTEKRHAEILEEIRDRRIRAAEQDVGIAAAGSGH